MIRTEPMPARYDKVRVTVPGKPSYVVEVADWNGEHAGFLRTLVLQHEDPKRRSLDPGLLLHLRPDLKWVLNEDCFGQTTKGYGCRLEFAKKAKPVKVELFKRSTEQTEENRLAY